MSAMKQANVARRMEGVNSLCVAVLEQAIYDYFLLVRAGVVKWGRFIGDWGEGRHSYRKIDNMQRRDAVFLLEFIRGEAGAFGRAAELSRDWSDLWRIIQRIERSQTYKRSASKTFGEFACLNDV